MTPAQLEQQSRDAVIAYLQDSSVRLECTNKKHTLWGEKTRFPAFDMDVYYYRIAQPRPWYRVALTNRGPYIIASKFHSNECALESDFDFIRWLTERIEYDS